MPVLFYHSVILKKCLWLVFLHFLHVLQWSLEKKAVVSPGTHTAKNPWVPHTGVWVPHSSLYELYLWITCTIKWALYFISYFQSLTYTATVHIWKAPGWLYSALFHLFFGLPRMTFLSQGLGEPSCVQGDQHANLAWCFEISALGLLTHSIWFPSLQADLTIHIISIFLVDQPRIGFEPRLK